MISSGLRVLASAERPLTAAPKGRTRRARIRANLKLRPPLRQALGLFSRADLDYQRGTEALALRGPPSLSPEPDYEHLREARPPVDHPQDLALDDRVPWRARHRLAARRRRGAALRGAGPAAHPTLRAVRSTAP